VALGEVLSDINELGPDADPNAAFDYLAAIGMPPEFLEATSGDFLGMQAVESVGAAATDTAVNPFGDEFFVAPSSVKPLNAGKRNNNRPRIATPAKFIRNSYASDGKTVRDTEYSSPD
jgi:hypothetical protein